MQYAYRRAVRAFADIQPVMLQLVLAKNIE